MTKPLGIAVGECSDKGHKTLNQDFHGVMIPKEPLIAAKGIAVALADGIGSSDVSQVAAEASVKGFLEDYYSTSESWSVKTSAVRVLQAINSWLYAQTRNGPHRYQMDRGYVCTFSALVLKSCTAHIVHAGDTRVYRLVGKHLEQLTRDHRVPESHDEHYLSRALGMRDQLWLDYQSLPIETGDTFVLATDGVYEFVDEAFVVDTIRRCHGDLDLAARLIVAEALTEGSRDNLTIQIVRVERLPERDIDHLHEQASSRPFPPELRPRMEFDGYEILREIHNSDRSHLYLALDRDTGQRVVLKTPSIALRNDAGYLERFLMEEWVARRINNAHVLKPCEQTRKRHYLYIVTEFIQGQSLKQWMIDHPEPDIETVRNIIEQVAGGLQALHRQEMLHQDLRPNNIMIDNNGTAQIIDFGSVCVAGLSEIGGAFAPEHLLGTAQYTAPEYFLGEAGTTRSDMFSLGVITYQMLCGRLPYGADVIRMTSRAAQRKLTYRTVLDDERTIPAWVDGAIRKAVHPNPLKRYGEISEFVYDLRHPNPAFLRHARAPLLERHPTRFWQGVSLILAIIIVLLLSTHTGFSARMQPPVH